MCAVGQGAELLWCRLGEWLWFQGLNGCGVMGKMVVVPGAE